MLSAGRFGIAKPGLQMPQKITKERQKTRGDASQNNAAYLA